MNKPNIIPLPVQSFCFGVERAIKIVKTIITDEAYPKPFFLIGELVHNHLVTEEIEALGVKIILEESEVAKLAAIKAIKQGTIIFTAHGVNQKLLKLANEIGLTIVDTTCPFVKSSLNGIKKAIRQNDTIIYIGKKHHPETEAALSISPEIVLVERLSDIVDLPVFNKQVVLASQTTMSIYDIKEMEEQLIIKYPNLITLDKVCNSSRERQELIKEACEKYKNIPSSAVLVIGDKKSNNTNKLFEIACSLLPYDTYFIETIHDLDIDKILTYANILIASGTSTPLHVIEEIANYLKQITN